MTNHLLNFCIGIFAGISSGLFGIGGGVILMPILLILYKMNYIEATATSLTALLFPIGALAVYRMSQNGILKSNHFKMGAIIAFGMLFGALIGNHLNEFIGSKYMPKFFAIFLILLAIKLLRT